MKQGKSSPPKKHHFVPECYLNNFLSNSRLFVLNIKKVKKGLREIPHESHPKRICYLEDYYRTSVDLQNDIFKLSLEDPLHIEQKSLWNLENKYDTLFRQLTTRRSLSLEDAGSFADFILQMKLRNPFWLENTLEKKKNEWIDESISKIAVEIEKNSRYKNIPEKKRNTIIENYKNQCRNNSLFSKTLQLYSILMRFDQNAESNSEVRNILLKSTWSLIKAPDDGPFFVTTDNPGGAIGIDGLYYNTRFNNGFQFYFPLSPEFCLGITDSLFENNNDPKIKTVELLEASRELVILINDIEIQHVNTLIIAKDKWYLEQIVNLNKPHI